MKNYTIRQQVEFYRDGLIRFDEMTEAARLHLLTHDPKACPSGAWLDFMAE